jgi:hypothetical protein
MPSAPSTVTVADLKALYAASDLANIKAREAAAATKVANMDSLYLIHELLAAFKAAVDAHQAAVKAADSARFVVRDDWQEVYDEGVQGDLPRTLRSKRFQMP